MSQVGESRDASPGVVPEILISVRSSLFFLSPVTALGKEVGCVSAGIYELRCVNFAASTSFFNWVSCDTSSFRQVESRNYRENSHLKCGSVGDHHVPNPVGVSAGGQRSRLSGQRDTVLVRSSMA